MAVTPRQLAAAAAVVVVALASMATHPPTSGALPGPPGIAALSAPAHAARPAKPKIYTPRARLQVSGCVISVSNANPDIGDSSEAVTVGTTAGAWVSLSAGYATYTSSYGEQADQNGNAVFKLANPNATPGRTVRLAAQVRLQGSQAGCEGSFTPKSLACAVVEISESVTAGGASATVVVSSAPGAQVRLTKVSGSPVWSYAKSAPGGRIYVAVPIPFSEVGRDVRLQTEVAMLGARAACTTSFVPTVRG